MKQRVFVGGLAVGVALIIVAGMVGAGALSQNVEPRQIRPKGELNDGT